MIFTIFFEIVNVRHHYIFRFVFLLVWCQYECCNLYTSSKWLLIIIKHLKLLCKHYSNWCLTTQLTPFSHRCIIIVPNRYDEGIKIAGIPSSKMMLILKTFFVLTILKKHGIRIYNYFIQIIEQLYRCWNFQCCLGTNDCGDNFICDQ